jgi:septal ring factor EnvC (AmiA/AmiB activator)
MNAGQQSYLDRPDLDGTPRSHPSYWRGKAQGLRDVLKIASDIMMGLDNGSGVNNNPDVERMRRGLLTWRDEINSSKSKQKEFEDNIKALERKVSSLEKDNASLEKSLEKALAKNTK